MKKTIYVTCERCKTVIGISDPNQIGRNIGQNRILYEQCYEWENNPADF